MNLRRQIFMFAAAVTSVAALLSCSHSGDSPDASVISSETYKSGGCSVEMFLPPESLWFGDTAEIRLELSYPEDEHYILLPGRSDDSGGSNIILREVIESEPVYNGEGQVQSTILFSLEAQFPGAAVFPSMTVRFSNDITTDPVSIDFKSAFSGEESRDSLAPVYIPEDSGRRKSMMLLVFPAVVILLSASVIIFMKVRKNRQWKEPSVPTFEQQIEEFKKLYISKELIPEPKEALVLLRKLIEKADLRTSDLIREKFGDELYAASFSRNGLPAGSADTLIREIFELLEGDVIDEL